MIGNDIIDLALAKKESNWKRKGFLDKLFLPAEQAMILKASNPEARVWDLWSRKEAAYKIYNRETKVRAFIPLQIECFDIEMTKGFSYGKVHLKNHEFFTKTEITLQYIHTVAAIDREKLNSLSVFFSSDYKEMIVKDEFGIPYFKGAGPLRKHVISISHHGDFCSYIST